MQRKLRICFCFSGPLFVVQCPCSILADLDRCHGVCLIHWLTTKWQVATWVIIVVQIKRLRRTFVHETRRQKSQVMLWLLQRKVHHLILQLSYRVCLWFTWMMTWGRGCVWWANYSFIRLQGCSPSGIDSQTKRFRVYCRSAYPYFFFIECWFW